MVDLAQQSLLPNDPLVLASDEEQQGESAAQPASIASRRSERPRRSSRSTGGSPDTSADPVLASLLRIEALMTTLTRVAIQPVLEQELTEPSAKAIYEATGTHTVREIAAAAGLGIATISRTWARWEKLGLVVKDGTQYRRTF